MEEEFDFPESTLVGLPHEMPLGGVVEVHSSKPIDEGVGMDEQIEGITYNVYWGDTELPLNARTQLEAMAIAFGCQWGAYEMVKKLKSVKCVI